ncbi:MAG: acyltransferase family protein [Burkholderiaceae bacterium]|nr:acyltransferase family protein [Microbacteriaceae bacterium]
MAEHPGTPTAAPTTARFAGLDGLRAIAVTAVLLYHLAPGVLEGGYLGVDLFFVISGFLITSLLLRERAATGRIGLRAFWLRRARRLLPALGLLLLACCTAAWVIGGDVLVGLGRQLLGATTFSSNWLSIAGSRSYFEKTAPELFRNLWSLAVEEQFYLAWPLLLAGLLLLRGRAWPWAVVSGLALASALAMAALHVPGADATRVYYGTDTHSFGLLAGALTALAVRALSLRAASDLPGLAPGRALPAAVPVTVALGALGGTIAAMVLLPADSALAYRGGLAAVAVLASALIWAAVTPGSPVGRALDAAPLRWVGERSYGLYLWHWPVFVLVVSALPGWSRTGAPGWALGGIALIVTVAAASFSHRFVEQPVRRLGFRAATLRPAVPGEAHRRIVAIGATVALTLGGIAGTSAALGASPYRSDAQANIEAGIRSIERVSPGASDQQAADVATPLPGGDRITAIGDSVMLASAPELQNAFPGISIDAVVSRQLADAPALLASLQAQGTLRPVVLIGLGTNGPIDDVTLEGIRTELGAAHEIVVVNVQAPRGWTDGVNAELTTFAGRHRDVELANWRDAIAGNLSLLARDQIHPGGEGGAVYAAAVRDALQRLAEIPPLLRPGDYGLAPRPE